MTLNPPRGKEIQHFVNQFARLCPHSEHPEPRQKLLHQPEQSLELQEMAREDNKEAEWDKSEFSIFWISREIPAQAEQGQKLLG